MGYIAHNTFVSFYAADSISDVPHDFHVNGESVEVRFEANFHGKKQIPATVPNEIKFKETEDGILVVTTSRIIPVSDIPQNDFYAETASFFKKTTFLFKICEENADFATWKFISSGASLVNSIISFCESSKSLGILDVQEMFANKRVEHERHFITKVPLTKDGILLEMRCSSPANNTNVFLQKGNEEIYRFGFYSRTQKKLCLFGEPLSICEYINDNTEQIRILRDEDISRAITAKILETIGSHLSDDEMFAAFYVILPEIRQSYPPISFSDLENIIEDQEKWVAKKVDEVLSNNKLYQKLHNIIDWK